MSTITVGSDDRATALAGLRTHANRCYVALNSLIDLFHLPTGSIYIQTWLAHVKKIVEIIDKYIQTFTQGMQPRCVVVAQQLNQAHDESLNALFISYVYSFNWLVEALLSDSDPDMGIVSKVTIHLIQFQTDFDKIYLGYFKEKMLDYTAKQQSSSASVTEMVTTLTVRTTKRSAPATAVVNNKRTKKEVDEEKEVSRSKIVPNTKNKQNRKEHFSAVENERIKLLLTDCCSYDIWCTPYGSKKKVGSRWVKTDDGVNDDDEFIQSILDGKVVALFDVHVEEPDDKEDEDEEDQEEEPPQGTLYTLDLAGIIKAWRILLAGTADDSGLLELQDPKSEKWEDTEGNHNESFFQLCLFGETRC